MILLSYLWLLALVPLAWLQYRWIGEVSEADQLRRKGELRVAMERIAQLAVSGAVKAQEVKLFKLSEAAETHRISQGRHFRGKLMFKVR